LRRARDLADSPAVIFQALPVRATHARIGIYWSVTTADPASTASRHVAAAMAAFPPDH
jgi:hypothetical protein